MAHHPNSRGKLAKQIGSLRVAFTFAVVADIVVKFITMVLSLVAHLLGRAP